MDTDSPELARIFRDELNERSQRLVAGARDLAEGELLRETAVDLVRDAHTIKGSASLLEHQLIRDAGVVLESAWRMVAEGREPSRDIVVAMEAIAGRLVAAIGVDDDGELRELIDKLARAEDSPDNGADVLPLRQPDSGSLDGLLASVSSSLLGGATRVDTGDLYRMIN